MPSLIRKISQNYLIFDIWTKLCLTVFLLLTMLYLIPFLEPEDMLSFIQYYLDFILFGLMAVLALEARSRFRYRRERAFFAFLASAYAIWIVLKITYLIPAVEALSNEFIGDLFYLLFYGALLAAAAMQPGMPRSGRFSKVYRWNQNLAPFLFLFALFLYFSFAPATWQIGVYDTYIPSFTWFIIMDFFLCIQFAVCMARASNWSWRIIYGCISLHMGCWCLVDIIQTLDFVGLIHLQPISSGGIFWYLPYAFFMVAMRIGSPPQDSGRMPTWIRDRDRAESGALPLLYGLSLPLFHFTVYGLGLYNDNLMPKRSLVVAGWLVVIGVIILWNQRIISNRTGLLETMRSRNVALLKSIGLIQNRFIETADATTVFNEQVKQACHLSESYFCLVAEIREAPKGKIRVLAVSHGRPPQEDVPISRLNHALVQALDRGISICENDADPNLLTPLCPAHTQYSTLVWMPLLHGSHLVGVIALSGRDKGYDRQLVRYMEPYLKTCAGIIGAFRNEQERQRIAERERRFNQILDESLEEIYIFDAETLRFIQANRGARENLGYTKAQMTHLGPYNLIPDMEREAYLDLLAPLYAETKDKIFLSTEHQRRDGTTYPVDIYVQRSSLESVPVFVGFVVDISRRRDMEVERDNLTAQVIQAQKMETVGTLAGGIAHDFNNVLAPIIWCSEMMIQEMPSEEEAKANLEQMLLAAKRARDLIQQLLTFSRRSVRRNEPVHLADVIEETILLLQASRPRNVLIDHKLVRRGDLVMADPSQMQQVVMNLCTNAFYAMRETGGTLTLELDPVDVGQAYARKYADLNEGRFVRLRVSDEGPGMDAETRQRIFEPFFTTKPVGEGTGLGLAVLHGIIMSHGGTITVDSEPGEGTVFQIFMPPHRGLEDDLDLSAPDLEESPKAHLLIVDSDEDTLQTVRTILEAEGFQVTTQTDSVEALNLFRAHNDSIDMVIADQHMPRMTGLEMATRLMSIRPNLPVVLTSGAGLMDKEHQTQMGVRTQIAKPIDSETLCLTVAHILARRRDQATGQIKQC